MTVHITNNKYLLNKIFFELFLLVQNFIVTQTKRIAGDHLLFMVNFLVRNFELVIKNP